MTLAPSTRRTLRRIQVWTGVAPLALFLLQHFATNATALGGPTTFRAAVAVLERLPFVRALEIALLAVPLAAHVALGLLLSGLEPVEEQGPREGPAWQRDLQRASGGFLALWLVFHVWSTRLSPAVTREGADLFDLVAGQVRHPAVFALYALGVIVAAVHAGFGLRGLAGHAGLRDSARLAFARVGTGLGALLLATGLAALFAFAASGSRMAAR